jgi:hypothetical protein
VLSFANEPWALVVYRADHPAQLAYFQSREDAAAVAGNLADGTPFTIVRRDVKPWTRSFGLTDAMVLRWRNGINEETENAYDITPPPAPQPRNGYTRPRSSWGEVHIKFLRPAVLPGHGTLTAAAHATEPVRPHALAGRGALVAKAFRVKRLYRRQGCLTPDCPGRHFAHGYCVACHRYRVRTGRLRDGPPRSYGTAGCVVAGCPRPHHSGGLCQHHHDARRRGRTNAVSVDLPLGFSVPQPPAAIMVGAGVLAALVEARVPVWALVRWRAGRRGGNVCPKDFEAFWTYHATRAQAFEAAAELPDGEPWTVVDSSVSAPPRRTPVTDTDIHRMRRREGSAIIGTRLCGLRSRGRAAVCSDRRPV